MKKNTLLALAFGCILLAGCASEPVEQAPQPFPPAPEPVAFPYTRLAPSAPPDQIVEVIPANPLPMEKIWRPGYWTYDGVKFEWIRGEFIERPAPTALWSSARWVEHDYGWAFIPGHWQ